MWFSKRIVIPNTPHHIIQRGNNRSDLFRSDDDFRMYLGLMGKYLRETRCDLLAYALMTNHVHLLLQPPSQEMLVLFMRKLNVSYARYCQEQHKRTGHIFESRYKSFPVDEGTYLWEVMRYIEMNPVRAGLVSAPGDHPYSSADAHLTGRLDGVLTRRVFDAEDAVAFAEFLAQPATKDEYGKLRHAIMKSLPYGDTPFIRKTCKGVVTSSRGRPRKRGRKSAQKALKKPESA